VCGTEVFGAGAAGVVVRGAVDTADAVGDADADVAACVDVAGLDAEGDGAADRVGPGDEETGVVVVVSGAADVSWDVELGVLQAAKSSAAVVRTAARTPTVDVWFMAVPQ
jgi:hypothetical protein